MQWRRRRNREGDLDREIRNDLDLEAAEGEARGLPPEAARYAAQRAFGNVALTKEEVRTMWGWTTWGILVQDFRYAIRNLRKSPGFTATAFLTLALGIGASTAVFTVVDSVLLRPLPYHESGQLVALWERVRFLAGEPTGPNPRHVDVWRKRSTAFSGLAVVRQAAQGITLGSEHPRLFGTVTCSANLFDILEVQPLLGRAFVPEDDVPGSDAVAMITYGLWQSLFRGDPGVIGKTIHVANAPRRIVGVLPPRFYFPSGTELRSFRRAGQTISGALEPAALSSGGSRRHAVLLERQLRELDRLGPFAERDSAKPGRVADEYDSGPDRAGTTGKPKGTTVRARLWRRSNRCRRPLSAIRAPACGSSWPRSSA